MAANTGCLLSSETRATNVTYFIGNDKSPLRNRDWQEGNRVYIGGPIYIILTVLREFTYASPKRRTQREQREQERKGELLMRREVDIETEKYIGAERVRQHVTEEMHLSRVTCRAALSAS